jgi:predicted CopG family antitoxin
MYINKVLVAMAKLISVSEEVYNELSSIKGENSFNELLKSFIAEEKNELAIKKSKVASKRILARIEKGYNLGKIMGTRDDWHAR